MNVEIFFLLFFGELFEMVSSLSAVGSLKLAFVDILNLGRLKAKWMFKNWGFQSFNGVLVICSLIFFLGAICSYYVFPDYWPVIVNNDNTTMPSDFGIIPLNNETVDVDLDVDVDGNACNVFDGRWLPDQSYPLYNGSLCPFAERGFNCLANGRRDTEYLRWRWQPKDCDIPRFDVNVVLEWLRGKRVVFVGDSLSRTQWESMICMLMTGIGDQRSVYEVNGHRITRQIRYLSVRFSSFNFTVEFYRSVFLVQLGQTPKRAPKRVKRALHIDKLDDISKEWIHSDILIFNTGHWWTPTKLFDVSFRVGGRMKLGMSIPDAFKIALSTWKFWVESNIDTSRTRVFFRTFEATHWRRGSRESCHVTREPLSRVDGMDNHPFSDAIMDVIKNVSVPVQELHVTAMGAFRSDAHVGTWSDNPSVPDCSHWCLPGVPDTWNELLFSYLI